MTPPARRIIEEVLALPEAERRQVTAALIGSMEQSLDEQDSAWLDEVERRIARAQSGEAPALDGEATIAQLRDKLRSVHTK